VSVITDFGCYMNVIIQLYKELGRFNIIEAGWEF